MDENLKKVIEMEDIYYEESSGKVDIDETVKMIVRAVGNMNGFDKIGESESDIADYLRYTLEFVFGNDKGTIRWSPKLCRDMYHVVCGVFEHIVNFERLMELAVYDNRILRFPRGFSSFCDRISLTSSEVPLKHIGKGKNHYLIAGKEDLLQTYAGNKRCVIDIKDLLQIALYTGSVIEFSMTYFFVYDFCKNWVLDYPMLKFQCYFESKYNACYIAQDRDTLDRREEALHARFYLGNILDYMAFCRCRD